MKLFDLSNDISQTQESTQDTITLSSSLSGSTNITFTFSEIYKNSMLVKDSLDSDHPEIMSIEFGITPESPYYSGITDEDLFRRESAYKKYAKMLLDDQDSKFLLGTSSPIEQCFIINLSRSLKSSEIKKGTFNIALNYGKSTPLTGSISDNFISTETGTILPYERNINSEFRKLYFINGAEEEIACGVIFYQPGIIIIDPEQIFEKGSGEVWTNNGVPAGATDTVWNTSGDALLLGNNPTSDNLFYGLLERITEIEFDSITTEFYTNYFVKAEANEFNYSSNPTYVDTNGDIVIIGNSITNEAESFTYITGIGLYDENENLLAVAKLSSPIKKDWSQAKLIKVRVGN